MQRRNMILGGFAVLGLGGWALTNTMGGERGSALAPFGTPANAQTAGSGDPSAVSEMVLGNEDAPVTVVEYASFTCPHCARFHADVFGKLKADYIDTGKVRFVYREVYFDRYGLWASMVARCGGQERFFGIVDLIYKGQAEWTRAGEPAAIVGELRKIGRLAGLDGDTLETCLQDAGMAQNLVAWDQQNREADGIDSTPSFTVNGTKYSNMSYGDFQALLDRELGDA